MALDAATLLLLAAELRSTAGDARIDKIFQPTRDEVLLQMRSRTQSLRLLLSARSGSARVCLTDETYENPAVAPSYCMLLRKHLTGGRLVDVRTLPGERIVFFDFLCTNEMGDLVTNTLAAELMGRYSNLVLIGQALEDKPPCPLNLTNRRITDALKRVDFEDSDIRQLLPGLPYTLPPMPAGLDFITAPFAHIKQAMLQSEVPAGDALRKACVGVGPVIVREALYRALPEGQRPAAALSAAEWEKLEQAMESIRADFAAGGHPCLVRKPDGMPAEFSFTPLTQYLPACTLEEYEGFSAMLEAYYAQKDRAERLKQKSKQLRKTVHNLYERALRKQAARMEDLAKSEKSDHLRIAGELLTANLHAFAKGDTKVTVANWYDEGRSMEIELDVRLTPSGNAQKYFKEYKKRQTAARMLAELLDEGKKEIAYLETVLYEVDSAQGDASLGEIRAELKSQGYLKYYKQRDKKQKPADFLRYTSTEGFTILVGRNNLQNEKLTMKTARGKDLWFHTKNAPGSHVVVMSEGQDIPLATQNEAAMLAVWHSSQKNGVKVPVDYTIVKNIRKTGDLPPGMVLYEHYETAYITPAAEVLAQLGAQ